MGPPATEVEAFPRAGAGLESVPLTWLLRLASVGEVEPSPAEAET